MELQEFAWIIFRFKKEAVESEAGMLLPRQHDSMSWSHATAACSDLGARSATSQNFFYTGSVVLCGIMCIYIYICMYIYIYIMFSQATNYLNIQLTRLILKERRPTLSPSIRP